MFTSIVLAPWRLEVIFTCSPGSKMSLHIAVVRSRRMRSLKSQCRNVPWQDITPLTIITEQISINLAFKSKGSMWNGMAAELHKRGNHLASTFLEAAFTGFQYPSAGPRVPNLESLTDAFETRCTGGVVIGGVSKGSCYPGRGTTFIVNPRDRPAPSTSSLQSGTSRFYSAEYFRVSKLYWRDSSLVFLEPARQSYPNLKLWVRVSDTWKAWMRRVGPRLRVTAGTNISTPFLTWLEGSISDFSHESLSCDQITKVQTSNSGIISDK
ncbi:uncharacterized protein BDZ83DRAFT_130780 [Colletotrichum acutatum]|uniref:Uncharacterized protein n=1 Tax=Glomerella acutata TaxID=27357 RepID=A0AAD8UBN4_GLOAC|nr:uncharacterized protein BDZ83DRAFT_130780 [Colletotrichum acutatum]KAK1710551.1 hypothetical protein BDZ83DRAFT_130780 [Colletotrichum acutatum]